MTSEQYVAELNRYATSEIASIFKISEASVEAEKAGKPHGDPIQWPAVVRVLQENGHPV